MGNLSPGEGISYPLQYSWAPLVAQMGNNSPAMRETWVQSLGWEDPLEEVMATHSSILAWRIPMDRGAWRAAVHGLASDLDTTERLSTAQYWLLQPGIGINLGLTSKSIYVSINLSISVSMYLSSIYLIH